MPSQQLERIGGGYCPVRHSGSEYTEREREIKGRKTEILDKGAFFCCCCCY